MAFIDPIVLAPAGGSDIILNRVSTGENRSSYRNGDSTYAIKAEHNYARRTRRVFRLDVSKTTPDPFIPSQNVKVSASIYLVADLPVAGFDNAEVQVLVEEINTYLQDSDPDGNLNITRWLEGQS
jgi:hypothetical protein